MNLLTVLLLSLVGVSMSSPEQMHLSLTEREGELRVMWVRPTVGISSAPSDERCYYGTSKDALTSASDVASAHTYSDGGFAGSIYSTILHVSPSTVYFYQCGSQAQGSLSKVFSFRAPPAELDEDTIHVALFGDMGTSKPHALLGRDSSRTQKLMNSEAEKGLFDLVIDVGDSGYANDHPQPNAHINDIFFNEIEPTIASAPFMLCPGNHEAEFNFAPYLNRTMMPIVSDGPLARFYNSWNFGPLHVVTFSTEHDISVGSEQWKFVENDLKNVNRTLTPWVFAFSHHPMYCSDLILRKSRCGSEAEFYRKPMEPLFHQYHVDVFMAGHNHQYERSWPTFENKRVQANYISPNATTYITNGAAGDMEGIEPWGFDPTDRSHAKGSLGFASGFMRLHANRSALVFEYADASRDRNIDEFTIVK